MTGSLALMAFLCGPAQAASRVVVSTPEPLQIFVDGMILPTSIGNVRTSIPHITPGEHDFAFHSLTGVALHSEKLLIPDNADVRVTYIPGAALSVTGAGGSALPAAVSPPQTAQASNAPGIASTAPAGPAQSQSSVPRQPTTGNIIEGSAASVSRGSTLQRVMTSPTPTNLIVGASRGLKTMSAGSYAGANFGKAPPAQQTIKKANVVYGQAVFKKSGGGPLVIYEAGHMIAQLGAGEAEAIVQLEVGRRELEIRSGTDYRILYQGDLQVDRAHVESVNISETSPPRATIRPWLWKDL